MGKLNLFYIALLVPFLTVASAWTGDIVFEDNFDGTALDLSKWDYQEGCGDLYGSGNLQCYTRNNVRVSGGSLIIEALPQVMEDKEYTSGRIVQRGAGFVYGAYVIRARLARGDHLWPALWLLNLNSECRYEELDIAEYRGQASEARSAEMAGHWGRRWDALVSKGIKATGPSDLSADYHEFALLWLPTKLEWYIDNELYFEASLTDGTFTSDQDKWPCRGSLTPFDERSNFIFNLAIGGGFFEQFPNFDPSTWSKPSMEIDWVRIYQDA